MNRKEIIMYNHKMDQWGYIHNTEVTLLEDKYRETDHKILGQQIMNVADKYFRLQMEQGFGFSSATSGTLFCLDVLQQPLHCTITSENEIT
jgi:hypothetical protein